MPGCHSSFVRDQRPFETFLTAAAKGLFALDIPEHLRVAGGEPNDECRLCARRTLEGRISHPVGRSGPEQRVAALLRRLRLHAHTLALIGGHEADIALPLSPQPVVVEYDGNFWHAGNADLERRQRAAWERAGFRVVRLREPPLEATSEWDLVLPGAYRSYGQEVVSGAIGLHVVEAGRVASMAESQAERATPAAPEGWWVASARDVRDGVTNPEVARWRTWAAANLGIVTAFEAVEHDWELGEIIGELHFVRDEI